VEEESGADSVKNTYLGLSVLRPYCSLLLWMIVKDSGGGERRDSEGGTAAGRWRWGVARVGGVAAGRLRSGGGGGANW